MCVVESVIIHEAIVVGISTGVLYMTTDNSIYNYILIIINSLPYSFIAF